MQTTKSLIMTGLLVLILASLVGCSSQDSNPLAPNSDSKAQTTEGDDIVDTAIGAGIFETLVAAVQAAELEEALRGEGPLTVFAPTDDAGTQLYTV